MKTTSELLDRFVELFNDDRFDEIPDTITTKVVEGNKGAAEIV